jgi:flagellar protein FliS
MTMYTTTNGAARAYAQVGLETTVAGASPHRLVLMLFDGALAAVARAREAMAAGRLAQKGELVSKAIQIVDEGLRASLDRAAGGALADQLDSLYEYMTLRLLLANRHNRVADLDEVARLLGELRGAWQALETGDDRNAGVARLAAVG